MQDAALAAQLQAKNMMAALEAEQTANQMDQDQDLHQYVSSDDDDMLKLDS